MRKKAEHGVFDSEEFDEELDEERGKKSSKGRKKGGKKKSSRLMYVVMAICVVLIVFAGYQLVDYLWTNWQAQLAVADLQDQILTDEELETVEEETDEEGQTINSRYAELLAQNADFIGWIEIEDTAISYPVMYTPDDEEFYLHRNFSKEYEYSGLPFIDADCSISPRSTNIVIYGHNMKVGTMFHDLMNYKEQDFYEEHTIITFNTIYEDAQYEIVAVILAQALSSGEEGFRYYAGVDFDSEEEFDEYMENIHALELYDTGVDAQYGDQLLTLSTCEYSQDNGRLAVIAKKIQ